MNSDIATDGHLIVEVERYSWGILALLVALSLLFLTPRVAAGILTGGLICIFNFRWLKSFIRRVLFCGDSHRAKALVRTNYFLRYSAVGVILFVVLKEGLAQAPATVVGLSVIFMAIAVVGIKRALTETAGRRT